MATEDCAECNCCEDASCPGPHVACNSSHCDGDGSTLVERLSDADPMAAACARLNIQLAETAIERDQLKAKVADYGRELDEERQRRDTWHRNFEDADKDRQQLRADNEALRRRLHDMEQLFSYTKARKET